ncbi:RCC1 and BTB domain-containing protein 1-like [Cloeon dipterum]|uniref:RCC1 and BTB domain-containing protein 1-like n=1 Tax=Cloeon dipterum TaxID=197152 RepID=UPI0032204533
MTFRPLRPKLAEPIIEEKNTANESPEWLRKSFDDFETADVVFVVEGKKIHAHKAILIMRCDVFRTIFQGDWTESNESEQIIEHQSYGAFYAFLKYFYTDDIDLPPDSALELLDLAHFYHLPVLQEKCGQLVKRGVTVENAAAILEKAIYYESKDLEEYVFQFCLDHMTGVISSDGFKKLDKDTVSEFLKRAAQYGAFKN